jgi:hypothetical protein
MDLVTYFGVQTFELVQEPSRLIPALPLLRSAQSNSNIPAAKLKKDIIKQSHTMSARDLNNHIKTLKVKYGFTKTAPAKEPKETIALQKIENLIFTYKEYIKQLNKKKKEKEKNDAQVSMLRVVIADLEKLLK